MTQGILISIQIGKQNFISLKFKLKLYSSKQMIDEINIIITEIKNNLVYITRAFDPMIFPLLKTTHL